MKILTKLLFLLLPLFTLSQSPYQVTRIVTDFGGYWNSTTTSINSIRPNNSHHLLMFRHNGANYSTGVNDNILTTNGITFKPGNFKALPVELNGNTSASGATHPTYIIVGRALDGNSASSPLSSAIHTHSNIKDLTMQSVVMDGVSGLNLGTGYTNLGSSVSLRYQISILVDSLISDNEPDILITQIADPSTNTDTYSFVDVNNNVVGNSITFNMTTISRLGIWDVDLFTLPFNTDIEIAKPTGPHSIGQRDIRVSAIKLSDFGLNTSNYHLVKGLRIVPSGTSDVAFIGYNVNAIKASPIVSRRNTTDTLVCVVDDTARLSVNVISSFGDTLSYQWEKKVNNDWVNITNNGKYFGVNTKNLSIIYDGETTIDFDREIYRIKVSSSLSSDTTYSSQFKVSLLGSGCFLPVELLFFNGLCTEQGNMLRWATASEFNSSHFEVMKSLDGENWRVIKNVNSAGFSTEKLNYEIIDESNVNVETYYRLNQVDINGDSKLYDPISVTCEYNQLFKIYPNPSYGKFKIILNNNHLIGESKLNIYNIDGSLFLQSEIEVLDGINIYELNYELPIGVYLVQIENGKYKSNILRYLVKN
jgi:hypothetical protein